MIDRAFLAVVPSPAALDAVSDLVASLRAQLPGWRWTARDHWHITLRFLGRVDDEDTLLAAVGAAAGSVPPTTVQLRRVGAFPSAARARVVWVGVDEGAPALRALAGALEAASSGSGDAAEARGFTPHLTIARLPVAGDVRPLFRAPDDPVGPAWTAGELVLFESRLGGPPPRYVARARFALAG